MGQGEEQQTIKLKSSITKGASAENPFGSFTFNYNFYEPPESNDALGAGEIKTIGTHLTAILLHQLMLLKRIHSMLME